MESRTRKSVEGEISDAVVSFEKEFMGRGPLEIKTYLMDDLVIVRLKDVLTPAEKQLADSQDPHDGRVIIKRMRHALLEKGRPLLEAVINDILGKRVISLHTDLSTKTGEKIVIFTLDSPPELV